MVLKGDSDSSDSDAHWYVNNQRVIIIPMTKRNDSTPVEVCRTENGVTMIPSKLYVVTLKSIKCLKKHMRDNVLLFRKTLNQRVFLAIFNVRCRNLHLSSL